MKKILSLMLALTCAVCAEVTIKERIAVVFPIVYDPENAYNIIYDTLDCRKYMSLEKNETGRSYLDSWGWCGDDVCSSVLDSSVFLLEHTHCGDDYTTDVLWRNGYEIHDGECTTYEFVSFSDATHSLAEVVMDELRHFQRCRYLDITDERMDSILADMERLVPPALEIKRPWLVENIYITDCENRAGCMEKCDATGGCFEYIFYTNIEKILAARNGTESLPYRMDFAARIAVENGRLVVPADLIGRSFVLFNLNGRVLRKGELRSDMVLPHEPAVLRVKGYGDMYLK